MNCIVSTQIHKIIIVISLFIFILTNDSEYWCVRLRNEIISFLRYAEVQQKLFGSQKFTLFLFIVELHNMTFFVNG